MTRFRVYGCRDCELIYLWPLPSNEEIRTLFSELYSTGGGSLPELRDYYGFCFDDKPQNPLVQTYEAWLDEVERHHPTGRLLDVGCGTGLFLAVARRRGWSVLGLDESEEATRHARSEFDLDVREGDFTELHRAGDRFDVVTGWDIIEHTREPIKVLEEIRACLAPGGIVALSTPNQRSMLDLIAGAIYRLSRGRIVAPLEKFYIEQHFLYFTPSTLTAAVEAAGLEVVRLQTEETDLRRLSLNPVMRLILAAMFLVARPLGRRNRILLIARAAAQ
jgi:2-polyprenyl-3-methyl-5-hydroxy-6-metoxy-1,4-benzoquinol methylase